MTAPRYLWVKTTTANVFIGRSLTCGTVRTEWGMGLHRVEWTDANYRQAMFLAARGLCVVFEERPQECGAEALRCQP